MSRRTLAPVEPDASAFRLMGEPENQTVTKQSLAERGNHPDEQGGGRKQQALTGRASKVCYLDFLSARILAVEA